MKEHVFPAIRLTLVLMVLLCGVYPAVVWGIGQIAFKEKANGSLLYRNKKVVGSSLIGQTFTSERFFHSRPSAAGSDGYDASASSGSNLGPTSQKLHDQIAKSMADYKDVRPAGGIPADAVTASGSGLDPHISPANAHAQAPRIARANRMRPEDVQRLIDAHTSGRFAGVFGEPAVNVLELNLELAGRAPGAR